jgi:N-acyl-D-aspartate/D-glutamate deacylase
VTGGTGFRSDPDFDLCIRGGDLLDGVSDAPQRKDLGVLGDTIVAIGDLSEAVAHWDLDARGLVVAPGFIDVHSHSDPLLLIDPSATTKVLQGVTTEVVGNCGMGVFPRVPGRVFLGIDLDRVLPDGPTDLDEYARWLESAPPALNVAVLMGFGAALDTARSQGRTFAGALRLAERGLAQGAVGVSIGLTYDPDRQMNTQQLVEIGTVVRRWAARLTCHIRDEGAGTFGLSSAVSEVVAVAQESDCSLQISHLKAIGPAGWSQLQHAIDVIDTTARSGCSVAADAYPYSATETLLNAALRVSSDDPEALSSAIARRGGAERLVLSHSLHRPDLEGLDFAAASKEAGADPISLARELLEDPTATVISHSLRPTDVDTVMAQPWCGVASDGMALGAKSAHLLPRPHPRSAGTFPKLLGEHVRDRKHLSLGQAIRKCTSQAADAFMLRDRGRLAVGLKADVTTFDPRVIAARADYAQPLAPPLGIRHVIVNGSVAVDGGQQTAVRSGRVLRGGERS